MFEVSEELRICSRCRKRGHYSKDCKIRHQQGSFESMKTTTFSCSFPSIHNRGRKNSFSHKTQQITSHYARKYKYHENDQAAQKNLRYTPKSKLKEHDSKNRFDIYSTTGLRQEYKDIPSSSRNFRNLYRNNRNEKCIENARISHPKGKILSYPAYKNIFNRKCLQAYCCCEQFSKQHDICHNTEKMSRHTHTYPRYDPGKKQIEIVGRTNPQDKYAGRSKEIENTEHNPTSTNPNLQQIQDNDNSRGIEYVSGKESVNNAHRKRHVGLHSICKTNRIRFKQEENDSMKRENYNKPIVKKDQEYQDIETTSKKLYQEREEKSDIGSKTSTEPIVSLASEAANQYKVEAHLSSISVCTSDNKADSSMGKVSSTQENDTEEMNTSSQNGGIISSSTSSSVENVDISTNESYTDLLGKYEELKERTEDFRLEIATTQIEKSLVESSLDFLIEQVGKLDSIEALENLRNRYAICSAKL